MDEQPKKYLGWAFWSMWVLVNSVAWIVGMALLWLLGIVLDALTQGVFSLLGWGVAGALFGAFFGVNHWFLFRPLESLAVKRWVHWWVLVTMGGWSVAILLVFGLKIREAWGFGLTGAVLGFFSSLPQWWLLRAYVQKAAWWVGLSTVVWAGAMALLASPESVQIIAFPFVGVLSGAATGAVMIWLLRHPRVAEEV
ncbi:MAG: hypothetical protein H6636_13500 [Anaerolineales bacterium]|nr:hypothetical protein [Anaerolineales bacterium]